VSDASMTADQTTVADLGERYGLRSTAVNTSAVSPL